MRGTTDHQTSFFLHFQPYSTDVYVYFAKCWSMLDGKTQRERELAWAKYFHEKKRKKKNSSVSICIVWGCWRRASVDRRHWGPSANIIHCHVGCLYLYFSFLFSPLYTDGNPLHHQYGQRSFLLLVLPSRKSSLFFNLVVKVCTRSYPNCSASVCSCGASGLYQQYILFPILPKKP